MERNEVYLELTDFKTCHEILDILVAYQEDIQHESLLRLLRGDTNLPTMHYNSNFNYWVCYIGGNSRKKINASDLHEILSNNSLIAQQGLKDK